MDWLVYQVAEDITKERIDRGLRHAERMYSGRWYKVRPRYLDVISRISKMFTTRKSAEQQPLVPSSKTQCRPA